MERNRPASPKVRIARLLRAISQPVRLEILLVLGEGEACVCHLETVLRKRQAFISQHLMELRKTGAVTSRRDGRNIYYQVADPRMLDLVRLAAGVVGLDDGEMDYAERCGMVVGCCCPHCAPESELQETA